MVARPPPTKRVATKKEITVARVSGATFVAQDWIDIGSAVGRELGVTEEQLRDLPSYRESSAFSDEERLVIKLAVEMAKTPVELPPALLDELHRCFDEAQLSNLAQQSRGRTTGRALTVCSECRRPGSP